MGMVQAEITLKNVFDVASAERGMIKESEIRQKTLTALVDTGAITIVINEEIRQNLGLEIKGSRPILLADGSTHNCSVTEPVDIHWKNRDTTCRALVMANSKYVLLGALPLEDMDLIVHPFKQELTGAHGDEVLGLVL